MKVITVVRVIDFGCVNTAIEADEDRVMVVEHVGEPTQEVGGVIAVEVADARAERQDALLAVQDGWRLEPLAAVVIRAEKAKAADVLVVRQLG